MKPKYAPNEKWQQKEREKAKKRLIIIAVIAGLMLTFAIVTTIFNSISNKKGLYYPDVILADALTGKEPEVKTTSGYNTIIKCPTLPYTFVIGDEVVREEDSYCVFLKNGMYICICEATPLAKTEDILTNILIPALNSKSMECTIFKQKQGYLNERKVESEGITVKLEKGAKIYTSNLRVFTPEGDVVISVISKTKNMEEAQKLVETVFYSMHYFDETDTPDIEDNDAETEQDNKDILTFDENGNVIQLEETEDYDDLPEDSIIDIITGEGDHIPVWNEPDFYERNVEFYVDLNKDVENARIYFAFSQLTEVESIRLIGPDGTEHIAYDFYTNPYTTYTFYFENISQGRWTIIVNSNNYLGNYYYGCIREADFRNQYGL